MPAVLLLEAELEVEVLVVLQAAAVLAPQAQGVEVASVLIGVFRLGFVWGFMFLGLFESFE